MSLVLDIQDDVGHDLTFDWNAVVGGDEGEALLDPLLVAQARPLKCRTQSYHRLSISTGAPSNIRTRGWANVFRSRNNA